MDDDEDIFANLESFCVDKNLDKAVENFTIKNYSLDDLPENLDNISEKVTAPKHSTKSRTKKQASSSSSQNESIVNKFTSNNAKCTRQKKKIDGANDNQTINNSTHNTKSADKADDSENTNLNNTSRRTRQRKRQNDDISNTKSTDEVNNSQNVNLNKTRRTRQRKGQNNDISTTQPTDEAAGISNNNTSLNNTTTTRQRKKGRRNNATDNFSTPPPLPPLSSTTTTTTTSNQASLSNTITTLMEHIMQSINSRRRSASNRRRGRGRVRGGRTRNNQYQPPTSIAVNQNACSRRNLIAEIAARAPVVDCIDLISSPIIRIQTTEPIDLDLEENENENENENTVNDSTDCNEEADNVTLKIKVKWGKDIKLFPCRKYQKFTDIIKHFAELENVPNENICLNLDEKIISENDTPDSINYKPHMFIYGRKVKNLIISSGQGIKDPNSIEIKIQCKEFKRPIIMSINKSNTFAVLYEKCSEELKIPTSKIVLKFDGETLNAKDKPVDFDLEGNEIIDCHVKK